VDEQTSTGVDDSGVAHAGEGDGGERSLARVFDELDDLHRRIAEHRRRVAWMSDHRRPA
jgi:hypothetical protein